PSALFGIRWVVEKDGQYPFVSIFAGASKHRYGTGSGSDRAPSETPSLSAPGRYCSRYRTEAYPYVICFDLANADAHRGGGLAVNGERDINVAAPDERARQPHVNLVEANIIRRGAGVEDFTTHAADGAAHG